MESVCESALNVPTFSSGAQECPKCVLTSLTRKISMRCRCKHSHGVLHRVTRFIELSLYLPFNIYTCGMECIKPLPFSLGWHLAIDKIYFLYLWWSSDPGGYSDLGWVRMCGPEFQLLPYSKTWPYSQPISKPHFSTGTMWKPTNAIYHPIRKPLCNAEFDSLCFWACSMAKNRWNLPW